MGRAVVIGVGNEFRRDDGVGPAVVSLLHTRGLDGVELKVCQGEATELMDLWDGAGVAVIVDAVRVRGGKPGRIHRLSTAGPSANASTHGLGPGDTMELARHLGRLPRQLVLYAVEVHDVDLGAGLSPAVRDAVPLVADAVVREVAACASPSVSG